MGHVWPIKCIFFSSERTDLAAAETRHLTIYMLQVKLLYYIMHTVVGHNYKSANRKTLEFKISIYLMKPDLGKVTVPNIYQSSHKKVTFSLQR